MTMEIRLLSAPQNCFICSICSIRPAIERLAIAGTRSVVGHFVRTDGGTLVIAVFEIIKYLIGALVLRQFWVAGAIARSEPVPFRFLFDPPPVPGSVAARIRQREAAFCWLKSPRTSGRKMGFCSCSGCLAFGRLAGYDLFVPAALSPGTPAREGPHRTFSLTHTRTPRAPETERIAIAKREMIFADKPLRLFGLAVSVG